jgi:DNA-binding transcriptional ArsR family regulator
MADAQRMARIFKALSVSTRVQIVQLLKDGTLCVNALADRLDVSPAAVSQHLRILRDADLVVADKRGYYVHYRVNSRTLERWRELADGLLSLDSSLPPRSAAGSPVSSEEVLMPDEKKRCKKPEALKGRPEECTPEQIEECHGDAEEHACEKPAEDGEES